MSTVAFEAKFGPGTDQTLIHELPPKASSLICLMRDVYLGKSDSVIGEVHRDRKTVGFEHTLRATPIVQLLAPIEILWDVAEAVDKTPEQQDPPAQKKEKSPRKEGKLPEEVPDGVPALSREEEKQQRIDAFI